jgi:hypothetical protein
MSAVPDSVMTLLASLEFDAGASDSSSQIMIDTFDQWHNPESMTLSACMNCGLVIVH